VRALYAYNWFRLIAGTARDRNRAKNFGTYCVFIMRAIVVRVRRREIRLFSTRTAVPSFVGLRYYYYYYSYCTSLPGVRPRNHLWFMRTRDISSHCCSTVSNRVRGNRFYRTFNLYRYVGNDLCTRRVFGTWKTENASYENEYLRTRVVYGSLKRPAERTFNYKRNTRLVYLPINITLLGTTRLYAGSVTCEHRCVRPARVCLSHET